MALPRRHIKYQLRLSEKKKKEFPPGAGALYRILSGICYPTHPVSVLSPPPSPRFPSTQSKKQASKQGKRTPRSPWQATSAHLISSGYAKHEVLGGINPHFHPQEHLSKLVNVFRPGMLEKLGKVHGKDAVLGLVMPRQEKVGR
jgi:hypothetical protein